MPNLTPDQVEDAARVAPDLTLATSFLSADARARVIALLLFHHEIARARSAVSEAGLAAIRLQWWRETIDHIYAGQAVRKEPTSVSLAATIAESNLPRHIFDAMIDAYESALEATPFTQWRDLEHYLDMTYGNLARLCLLAAGTTTLTSGLDEVARQSGIAWGLAQLVRALPQWLTRRSLWFPVQASVELEREGLFSGEVTPALGVVLKDVRRRIKQAHARTNQALRSADIGPHFPVIAAACLSNRYAKAHTPRLGKAWVQAQDPPLFERQIRLTLAVACRRL
jgi:phytoene/squalene synthetase